MMSALREVRHWLERNTIYESPAQERELIEAQRRDALLLIARLDNLERRLMDKENTKNA